MTPPYDHNDWGRQRPTRTRNGVPFEVLRALAAGNLPGYDPSTHSILRIMRLFKYNPARTVGLRYVVAQEKVYHEIELDRATVHAWLDTHAPEWRGYFPRAVLGSDGAYHPEYSIGRYRTRL